MTFPKRSMLTACATISSTSARASGMCERDEVVRVDRLAGGGERRAGGERGGDGREDVAPVERRGRGLEPVRREPDVDGLHGAAEARDREREQAVVGPDEDPVLLGDAHGDRQALAADLGVDDGEVHARAGSTGSARRRTSAPGAHVVARDAVGEVDDRRRPGRCAHHAVAHADEVVGERRSPTGT